MSKFNLIEENWISVITDEKGNSAEISLRELFNNAHKYKKIAGDTRTQDFAVLRVILAILQTVFSRFNSEGEEYGYFEIDENYRQIKDIDIDDIEDYEEDLLNTWENLWVKGEFPPIVNEYLDKWHDRFYLLDEDYPFFQVRQEDVSEEFINKANPSSVSGKNINRQISESGNKIALFSPKYAQKNNKEILSYSQLTRWLLTYQAYTGLADKVIFGKEKYQVPNSKGWLYDIGGLYFEEESLFKTLMLNLVLVHPEIELIENKQEPCWEDTSKESISKRLSLKQPNNLAELYTNWSRAIYIDPMTDIEKPFEFEIVKLPEIRHQDQFLEPMTIWRYNKEGENKNTFTPRKHLINQSLWRSFGLIAIDYDGDNNKNRKPGIIAWLDKIKEIIGDSELSIQAISMEADGNATSWVPVDEVSDYLTINDYVLMDMSDEGWVKIINNVIEETKTTIGFVYRNLLLDIKEIRNLKSNDYIDIKIEEAYFTIDKSFREWLLSIELNDSKEDKVIEWRKILKQLVSSQAKKIVSQAGPRDFTGIVKEGKVINIATAYNKFIIQLNKQLKIKEEI